MPISENKQVVLFCVGQFLFRSDYKKVEPTPLQLTEILFSEGLIEVFIWSIFILFGILNQYLMKYYATCKCTH